MLKKHASTFILIAFLIALLGLLTFQEERRFALFRDQMYLHKWVRNWGALAPLAIILLQAAQVLLAPIPGQALGLVSGYLFGVIQGTLYSVLGTLLGSLIAFSLARTYGRPLIERLLPAEILARLDAGAQRRGLSFFVLVFLFPFLPDDLACFVAGLTPIPIPALLLALLAGRPPGILISCWLGASTAGLSIVQWALLITSSILLAMPFLLYEEQLQNWAMKLVERLTSN